MARRFSLRTLVGVVLVVAAGLSWSAAAKEQADAPNVEGLIASADFEALEMDSRLWERATPEERQQYIDWFRATLTERYQALITAYEQRRDERRRASIDSLFSVFHLLYLGAPILLVLPFVYWKRFRGRRFALFGYGVVACVIFTLAITLFTLSLGLLKEFTLQLSAQLDPQLAMLNVTFATLYEQAHDIILRDDLPIGMTLRHLEGGAEGPFSVQLLYNLAELHERVFAPAAELMVYWYRASEALPHVFSLAMALFFAWAIKEALRRTWTMPMRAASGEPRAVRRALGFVLATAGCEVLAVFSLLAVLVVLNPLAALAVQGLARTCVGGLFSFCGATAGCLNAQESPPAFVLLLAVASVPAYMVMAVVAVAVASVLFLVRAHKVFRLRWHDKVPLRAQRAFWRTGTWAMMRAQWILVVFGAAALPIVVAWLPTFEQGRESAAVLRIVLAAGVLGFGSVGVFVFLRGHRALQWLWRPALVTERPSVEVPSVELQVEAPGPAAADPGAAAAPSAPESATTAPGGGDELTHTTP